MACIFFDRASAWAEREGRVHGGLSRMAKRPRTARRGAELLRYRAGNVGERGGRCHGPVVVTVRGPPWASLETRLPVPMAG